MCVCVAHDFGVCRGRGGAGGGGASHSVKWFLCSFCVSATVGSTCVNNTPLSFIVHEVRVFSGTWDCTLTNLQIYA